MNMKFLTCALMALMVSFVILVSCHSPTDPDPYVADTYEPTVNLHRVIWTGEKFVAVGDAIFVSHDGISWTRIQPTQPLWSSLIDISYANGKYVAIGEKFIAVSDDLTSWKYEWSDHDYRRLMMIAWSGTSWVVSGYTPQFDCPLGICITVNPFVLRSADSDAWREVGIGDHVLFSGVVWTDSQFVGMAGRIRITSVDGVVWERDSASTLIDGNLSWTGEELVCIGGLSRSQVYSFDGQSWTARGSVSEGSCVILADTLYVAVGLLGGVYTSVDLDTWATRHSVHGWSLWDVVWNEQIFVAVGASTILTSPDGITWTERDFR
jgi:hypothetical protein